MCQPVDSVEDKLLDQLPPSASSLIPETQEEVNAMIADIDAFFGRWREFISRIQEGADDH